MTRRTRALLAGVILAGAALGASARAQTPEAAAPKTVVRAAYVPAITWIAAWVAKDKGFFDAQGLDVRFTVVQNISLVPGTVGRQLDIAPATVVDLIKAAAGGLDVVAVAGENINVAGHLTSAIVVRKGSGIAGIKDFAGKTVATPTLGAILHVAFLYWLKKDGVDPNSIRAVEVPFPNMGDQMAAGRIDAAEAVEPFMDGMIAAGNIDLGDQILQVANPARSTLWIAERSWAAANKPVLAKWAAALRAAKDFIAKNPDAAREIVGAYTKLPPPVVKAIPIPDLEIGLTTQEIDAWIGALDTLGQLRRKVSAADMIVTAQ